MVERLLPKQEIRVRFPYPAQNLILDNTVEYSILSVVSQ